ncbi:alpha-aminoadipate carrier protein LysW [Paenibacillus algorifonticola]|uniref:Alpha-aminoadipate carrier protein LysW n=2 Tax=Paenibacillus TaxID=44249 RepID=A0A1I1Y215_9BACL|nr:MULTISPECIES: lysine biosynthesis protein LysW [Paenibacillus]ANY69855.1 lysine biosynthesis protein LysW [Paenibacillus sp. BIHB 4019]KQO04587.1 lysine biosynthesis protein LysW [Paenibacillus sp. Leaf72]SFE13402.1 alpha-aminoadipate carrier protein LysW [Paenibacillus algorifonticola]
MADVSCVVCKSEISVESDAISGEIVECSSCGQEHEVHAVNNSISVALAPEIEETWGE